MLTPSKITLDTYVRLYPFVVGGFVVVVVIKTLNVPLHFRLILRVVAVIYGA